MYYITEKTKAIQSVEIDAYKAVILEGSGTIYSKETPEEIIDWNCTAHGATLQGRKEHIRKMFDIKYRIPVPVRPKHGVVLFPTGSTKRNGCVWVSYYHVKQLEETDGETYIQFHDQTGILVDSSYYSLQMQFIRTGFVIANLSRNLYPGFGPLEDFRYD